jgi:hypothetical protein
VNVQLGSGLGDREQGRLRIRGVPQCAGNLLPDDSSDFINGRDADVHGIDGRLGLTIR